MLQLTLKEKYTSRANAIIKILAKKGWNLIKSENNKFILKDVTEEDQKDFIRYFTGETSWSPIAGALSNPMVINVKYFE